MKEFKDRGYIEDIQKKIPGYDLLHEIFMQGVLPEEVKDIEVKEVLSIAGQSREIAHLRSRLPESHITVVEPEPTMLELVQHQNSDHRIDFVCDYYENYPSKTLYEVCMCLFVLQFVKDERKFLEKIYKELQVGGIFCLSLFSKEQLSYWKNFALYKGADKRQVEKTYKSQREVMKSLSSEEVEKMLKDIGFTSVKRVFQCLSVFGWVVKK